MKIVTNHWGWGPKGIWTWLRYGWAWPVQRWWSEIHGTNPPEYEERIKVGPFCFGEEINARKGWSNR